jgi:arylformamidase
MRVNMVRFHDLSLPITEPMIVYPGNPKPKIARYASIPTDKTNESLICIGSHTGAQVDSKLHIQNNASGAASLPLDSFFGKAKVFDLSSVELEIHRRDLERYSIGKGDIVLLNTKNSLRGV